MRGAVLAPQLNLRTAKGVYRISRITDEMVAACTEAGLMRQKIPEQLVAYDGPLPRNATLKVLKFRLRDELANVSWP